MHLTKISMQNPPSRQRALSQTALFYRQRNQGILSLTFHSVFCRFFRRTTDTVAINTYSQSREK